MISRILESTKEKYVVKLNNAKAKRDAEIEKKCDLLRAELLAVPNAEIESLEKVIADLDALIEKEKAEEKDQAQQPVKVAEQVAEQETEQVVDQKADPIETAPVEVAEQEVEQPKVEVKEVEIEKPSFFQKLASMRSNNQTEIKKVDLKSEKSEKTDEKDQEIKIVKKPRDARAGMTGIFNPKRR